MGQVEANLFSGPKLAVWIELSAGNDTLFLDRNMNVLLAFHSLTAVDVGVLCSTLQHVNNRVRHLGPK